MESTQKFKWNRGTIQGQVEIKCKGNSQSTRMSTAKTPSNCIYAVELINSFNQANLSVERMGDQPSPYCLWDVLGMGVTET